jgi:nucleoside-diphosphate-sugar epimerase
MAKQNWKAMADNPMRVLVTGAKGQVGHAISKLLEDKGNIVVCSDTRLGTPHTQGELKALPSCEAIIHAAACLSFGVYDPEVSLTNCLGIQQIVELADAWKVCHLVYISSIQVIGQPQQSPVTEEHVLLPQTAYHASKLYGETIVRLSSCPSASLRITAPVGPRTPSYRAIATFVKRAMGNKTLSLLGQGTRVQNYVDVRDVALAVSNCLSSTALGVYNIAGYALSNEQLAHTCIAEFKSSSAVEFVGTDPEEGIEWQVSTDKAQQEFGYQPQHHVHDSIRTIAEENANRL